MIDGMGWLFDGNISAYDRKVIHMLMTSAISIG